MRSLLFASILATACSGSAYAQVAPGPRTAIAIAPDKVRAPYDVQVVRENGETLPTYAAGGRYYVQGNVGERYIIRVTNPTPYRVEAVVSVDGLDVVDGDPGDLRKRGYIVPPHGDVRIEGFRTSLEDVATFRFSSVDGSYAGQKGKARNVGVIAVAIFEEQHQAEEQQQIIVQNAPPPPPPVAQPHPYRYEDDVAKADKAPAPKKAAEPPASHGAGGATTATAPSQPRAVPPPPPADGARMKRDSDYEVEEGDVGGIEQRPAPAPQRTNRQGLGTEFGEQRMSGATYTRFVRATDRPIAIAELRYNDAAGLTALGIQVQPLPDAGEIMTRETADPFPGDQHFSRAP